MPEDVLLIGYRLNDALSKLSRDKEVTIVETKSPFIDNKNESVYQNPIVVKHIESENRVVLTVSWFK